MSKVFSRILGQLSLFLCVLVVLASCQTDENDATPKTITDVILEDPQFSYLRTAILHAGISDNLKGGNLTLFAPDNAAFQASNFANEAAITALPKDQVRAILLYHVLYANVNSAEIPATQSQVQTANGGTAYIGKTNDGNVEVNGASVTKADVQAANGTIHVIDKVLTPSAGNTLAFIQSNPNLTYLAAAIKRIEAANPTLTATLSGTATNSQQVTLFAPNDDAFKASANYKTISAIESANPQTLSNLLLYHVVSGVALSNQLQTGNQATLLSNSRILVNVSSNLITLKGNRNSLQATVRTPDIVTTNGVIHIIDQVLLP